MQRAERLLAIMLLLQARGKMTARHLADLLGVSIRTIYRDIDALSMAHVPIAMEYGPHGGYYLLHEYHMETAHFTREEAISLVLGGAMVGNYSLFADDEDMHRALLKLEATLPEEYRADVRAARERILFDTRAWHSRPAAAYLDVIRSALWKGQQLDILYPCADGSAIIWRRVDPYGLVYKGLSRRQVRTGIWYLVALCHCCQQVHLYRVSYIQDVQIRDESVQVKPGFDLQTYWRQERQHLEQQGQALALTLRVQPGARHHLRDNVTLLNEERDGSVIVRIPMESLEAAVSYVLSLGQHAVVISPSFVRDAVMQNAKWIASLYEHGI
jgi:predicted DNA-binding transcriptional regulator YafY